MAADSTTPRPVFPAGYEAAMVAAGKRVKPAASKAVAVRERPDICWYCGDEMKGKYSEISVQTGRHTCDYSPTRVHELSEVQDSCYNCDGSGQCLDCGALGCDTCGGSGVCVICDGEGYEPEPETSPDWDGDTYLGGHVVREEPERVLGSQVCPRCEGSGQAPGAAMKGISCGMCSGTGKPSKASGGQGTTSYGLGYPSYKPSYYKQLPTTEAEARTWRNLPWTSFDSKDAAKSDNLFVKTYGLYRDGLQNYHSCPAGRHWGLYGGAGMVPWTTAPDGKVYVLLSHRSMAVEQGGTWSSFGGAIDKDKETGQPETPFKAAVRETFEEVEGLAPKGTVTLEVTRPCTTGGCGWAYTTFLVKVEAAKVAVNRKAGSGWETSEVKWVPLWEVSRYNLHPGFAKTWPELQDAIRKAV